MSASIVLTRLSVPGVSDSPEPFYMVTSLGQTLFRELPDVPTNYGALLSLIFFANLAYLFGSLIFISRSVKKKQGSVNFIGSIVVIIAAVILAGCALWPLGSAWEKFKSPDHSARVAAMDMQTAVYDDVSRISSDRGIGLRVYLLNSDGTPKSVHSYTGTCEDRVWTYGGMSGVTCRESASAFIMYYKMNNKYGYTCADANWYGIVDNEPLGYICNGTNESGR
jgi:hypothetical protein